MEFSNFELLLVFGIFLLTLIVVAIVFVLCIETNNEDRASYMCLIPLFITPVIGGFIWVNLATKLDSSDYIVSETENEVIEYDFEEGKAVIPKGDNEIACVDVDTFSYGDKTVLVVERYEYKGVWQEKNVLYIAREE